MENEVKAPNEKVLNISTEEQVQLVHGQPQEKQQVVLYYPQGNHEELEDQEDLSSHSNIPSKYEVNEASANLLSIVDGSWKISEKEQPISSAVDPHESNDGPEIYDTQNESELKNVDAAVIINEEEVQNYLSNSTEAQEFFVLNQETGHYQKYIYIPPAEAAEKEENVPINAHEGFKAIVKEKVIEQGNNTKDDIVPTSTTEIAKKGKPNKCKVDPNNAERNTNESNSVIKTCASEVSANSAKTEADTNLQNSHYNHIDHDSNNKRLTKSSSDSQELQNHYIRTPKATQEKEQLKSSNLVTLSIENESMDDKQIRILTLCQNCNTLVADINGHAKSGVCDSEAYQASDDSQNSISNRVFLSADDLSKINFSPKVLDDLGGNRLNHSDIKDNNRKRKLGREEGKGEKWCNICEHTFPSQLKFANHLRRKDEFGRLCRPPPGKSTNFLSGIINYTQELSKPKKSRRIGIIRKGTQ